MFTLAALLSPHAGTLHAAEFVVLGDNLGATAVSADGRFVVGQTPIGLQKRAQAYI
jgi:hypothetical protein